MARIIDKKSDPVILPINSCILFDRPVKLKKARER